MEHSKIKQITASAASWQLTYAILILIGAVLSLSSNTLSGLFSIAMGVFAILSSNAAKKYASFGDSTDLLASFKHEKVYFIIGFVYYLLALFVIITIAAYFYYSREDFINLWDELANSRSRRNG